MNCDPKIFNKMPFSLEKHYGIKLEDAIDSKFTKS
jgi:hypothetical protein